MGVRVAQRHVAAPALRLARRDDPEAEPGQQLIGARDEESPQAEALGPDGCHLDRAEHVQRRLQREQREHRRRPDPGPADPGGRSVAGVHREWPGVPVPPGQWLVEAGLMPPRHVGEGGCAGAAGRVLVGAAHRHVRPVLVQAQRNGPSRVAQVPHRERAGVVRRRRQPRDIPPLPGPEVHRGPHAHRDLPAPVAERSGRVADPGDLQPEQPGDRVGQVAVGGKLPGVGQDHRSIRTCPGGGGHRIEQLNGRRVAGDGLPGRRADQRADAVTDPFRRRPARVIESRTDTGSQR